MQVFNTRGKIRYSKTWAVLDIDKEIVNYYYSLIPKYYYAQRQMHPGHITVVRMNPIEVVINRQYWGKYEGEEIDYCYGNQIFFKHPYYFLKVWGDRIAEIRTELGLPAIRTDYDCYHITIGNIKHEDKK